MISCFIGNFNTKTHISPYFNWQIIQNALGISEAWIFNVSLFNTRKVQLQRYKLSSSICSHKKYSLHLVYNFQNAY